MNTELTTTVQRFILHCNDAVLALCLNNRNQSKDEKISYDSTEENTQQSYQQLEKHLQDCQTLIESKVDKSTAKQIIIILAIHADEAILTSGLYSNGYLWPKLQKPYLGNKDGGSVFYQYCDELFATPDNDTASVIYEMLHYCLKNGFKGRHYNNQQALNYYNKGLSQQVSDRDSTKPLPKVRAIHEYA